MIDSKNKINLLFIRNSIGLVLSIIVSLFFILSKFIPKTKSEITKDILYTMDINCFEKSFRDVDVSIDEVNKNFNDLADWQDPNGDKLILGVISQVCRVEN